MQRAKFLALALAAMSFADVAGRAGYAHPEILVDTAWVAAHANDPGVRVVDMRTMGFAQGHIPGAVHLDNNAIRTADAPLFLPTEAAFARAMSDLGISDGTRVVVYDDRGGIYAARLWFVLKAFGHTNAALLDGGWTKWTLDKRPTSADAAMPATGTFHAKLDRKWVATADDVMAAIKDSKIKIVDARTQAEIEGRDLRGIKNGGAVPGSVPVYWEDALDKDSKTFKSADDITALYRSKGISPADAVITYCQVGMRAAHDLFTLTLIGQTNARVYYGSWDEWGNRSDLPIKK
jgi:thiosulfate/3-mercaptopyruvate sulfurtransferase